MMRVCRASLAGEEKKKKKMGKIQHCLVLDVDDHIEGIYMYTGRKSHLDSDGEGKKA